MIKSVITRFERIGREPILRRLKDGTLVCTFLTGGKNEPDNENVVMIAKSFDDGATWTEPKLLFSHPNRGCWTTEIWNEEGPDMAFVHTYAAESWYRELQTYRSFYDPVTKTWSDPENIKGTINGCSIRQGILLSNGDWLFPLYWQEIQKGCFSTVFDPQKRDFSFKKCKFITGVGISDDKGFSFTRYGRMESSDYSLWEPNAIELEAGHVIMYIRSGEGHLFYSESFDYGRSWTEACLSDIPNPDSKISLAKVGDTILLINNMTSEIGWETRTNLWILKSRDGKNFEKIVPLEDEATMVFYPHIMVDNDAKILYVAYENSQTHWLKKFTFQELGL